MPLLSVFTYCESPFKKLCLYCLFLHIAKAHWENTASFRVVRVVGLICQLGKVLIEEAQPIVQKRKGFG